MALRLFCKCKLPYTLKPWCWKSKAGKVGAGQQGWSLARGEKYSVPSLPRSILHQAQSANTERGGGGNDCFWTSLLTCP